MKLYRWKGKPFPFDPKHVPSIVAYLYRSRFRPNIVLKGAGAPFVEDVLTEFTADCHRESVDETLPIIRLVCKCTRCMVRIPVDFPLNRF